ncbi:hypothetical protein G7046_g7021 [Stylonectria norvegica]|nr:hypothetical protein G7046_g7021 [Stylonectria norvegica]
MEKETLGSLPDDLLLDIVEQLDTARDVARFATTARRTHNLVQQDGWRTFVKTRFPSLTVPTNDETRWDLLADRLTYLDRCWEKRGFWMNVFHEKKQQQQHGRYQRRTPGGQSVSFHAVLDSGLTAALDEEVVAAGVGENLVVRMKPLSGKRPDVWHQIQGKTHGYGAGTGDVTAVSVGERGGSAEVVVGRANGDIQVLSAEDGFSKTLQHLSPVHDRELNHGNDPMRKSPGQLAVSWTEWQARAGLLASCKGSLLTLHDLSDSQVKQVDPSAYYDFSRDGADDEASLLRSAKFMSKDVIACALGGSREPLRWGKITPTGLEFFNVASNPILLDDTAALTEIGVGQKTTVRAIEPVGGGGNANLLLSTWDDGTYRLVDIRTPSPQDAIYRDRFQPYEAGSSLLVYGTERFVAGSNTSPDIRLFDFRSPKSYHHTTAIPCSTQQPFPSQRNDAKAKSHPQRRHCNFQSGSLCPWHDHSRQDCYRPDATIHIGSPGYDRIYSLSKASDASSSIYCGLRGAILEMNLRLTGDDDADFLDQTQRTAPPGWRMGDPAARSP